MDLQPRTALTEALTEIMRELLERVAMACRSPGARREASRPAAPLAAPAGYRVARAPAKDPSDPTRAIDALAEEAILLGLAHRLPALGQPRFAVACEERGVLFFPADWEPAATSRPFLLILIDPVDSTDNLVNGFGGAVSLVAAEVRRSPEAVAGAAGGWSGAELHAALVGDPFRREIYWTERDAEGSYVDVPAPAGGWITEALQPHEGVRWDAAILSCLATKPGRLTQLCQRLDWLRLASVPLSANQARFLLHHGGPLPICRVASGDIHLAFDADKGYKPIDHWPGLAIAARAGCDWWCEGLPGRVERLPLVTEAQGQSLKTLEDQLLATLLRRSRFRVAANPALGAYAAHSFWPAPAGQPSAAELQSQREEAEAALADVRQLLEEVDPALAQALQELFHRALPHFVRGAAQNPLQHHALVAHFAVELGLAERLPGEQLRILAVAALLHDVGWAGQPKLRSSDLAEQTGPGPAQLGEQALAARRSHQELGRELVRPLLRTLSGPTRLSGQALREVERLVGRHDGPSVQELVRLAGGEVQREELIAGDPLLALLREADRLWLVTVPGLVQDLARDRDRPPPTDGEEPGPAWRLARNARRFRQELELYRLAYGDDLRLFGFRDHTLFRSERGHGLFLRLLEQARRHFGLG